MAMVRRSAPTRFSEPSATADGPHRICSSVPTVPTFTRAPPGQAGVIPPPPPVIAAAGGLLGARERGSDHHRIRAAGQCLGDVSTAGHPTVREDVHVSPAGFVEVVP